MGEAGEGRRGACESELDSAGPCWPPSGALPPSGEGRGASKSFKQVGVKTNPLAALDGGAEGRTE